MNLILLRSVRFLIGALILSASLAWGQTPKTISYQGVLTDAGGNEVPDGNYNLAFNFYDVAAGGTPLWTENQTISVSKGIFNVILGSQNPLTLPFDRPYWLGVTIGADPELAPRIQLTSSAYSLVAGTIADNTVTSAKIQDGTITGNDLAPQTIELANLAFTPAVRPLSPGVSTAEIADNAVSTAKIFPNIVSSLDGVNNDGGDIDLVAGANVTITPNDAANSITIAATGGAGGGDITAVTAGTGLAGGGTSGDVTLSIATGGITSAMIQDGAVATADLAANAVTNANILDGTIAQADLAFSPGDITAVNAGSGLSGGGITGDVTLSIATGGVTSAMILDAAITAADIGTNAVASDEIAADAVTGSEIATDAVGSAEIAENAVGSIEIAAGAVTGFDIANETIQNIDVHLAAAIAGTKINPDFGSQDVSTNGTVFINFSEPFAQLNVGGSAYIDGDATITGNLSKGSGSFKIDHPLDPANKFLSHSFVESPDMMNVYNGNVALDATGEAVVELPNWFEALNEDFRIN